MESNRDISERIAGDEAWLGGYSTPAPSEAVVRRVREAMRDELDAARLLGGTDPEASGDLLARTKSAVRRELSVRGRSVGAARWWWHGGLAAAACVLMAMGLWRVSPWMAEETGTRGLVEVMDELVDFLADGDVELALLSEEVGDLERREYEGWYWGESASAELSALHEEIDALGDEEPIVAADDIGGDV